MSSAQPSAQPPAQPNLPYPTSIVHTFRPEAASVGAARRLVGGWCADAMLPSDVCDTAVLLTSEVVTNALTHGRSEAQLTVTRTDTGMHVDVMDGNSRHPEQAVADPDALSGRGLAIVTALASRWGVQDANFGKTVWFELDVNPS